MNSHFVPRRQSCVLCLLVLACGLMTASDARANDVLRWKFKAGESMHYRMVQDTLIRANVGQTSSKTTISQTIDMTWKVLEVDAHGVASMTQTIDRMRVKAITPEGTIEADSAADEIPEALRANFGPIFKSLIGAKFAMQMTPAGKIQNVEVPEIAADQAGQSPSVGGMLSPESLKEMTQQAAIPLPEGAVEPGKSWTDEKSLADARLLVTYTYAGSVERDGRRFDQIDTKADLDLDLPKIEGFTAEVEKGEMTGEILFDTAAGKLARSKAKQDLAINFSGMGQSMRQEVQTLVDFRLVAPDEAAEQNAGEGR